MKYLVCDVSRYKRSHNHVYVHTMKKNNKKKTAIGPESVDDENDSDKEDNKKRKIPALVMWYLLVIDCFKCVFSNPRDAEMVRWHSEKRRQMMRRFDTLRMELNGIFLVFNINHLDQRVEI
jgi:hypothetical protein